MPAPSNPSHAPATSLSFITVGAILAVLAGTSYFYFPSGAGHEVLGYIRACCLILGIALVAIGFGVGHIGRQAREAERDEARVVTGAPAPNTIAPPPGHHDPAAAAGAQPPVYSTTTRNA